MAPANVEEDLSVVLDGIRPPAGSPDKSMPAFASLSDDELVSLVRYMRHRFAPNARDADLAALVKQARPRTQAGR